MISSKVGVGVLLLLLSSLPLLAHSETSENLINNDNWDGATYGTDPGGCCASISGSGALYDESTNTIMFSYGADLLTQTIAINQALQASGIEVDGFNYEWTYRLISNDGNVGNEELDFTVEVKDADGNLVETYFYDTPGSVDVWDTMSGTETFSESYLDPQSIALKIRGRDGGFWAGYYGPEVRDVSLTLNYSANPCAADPLYDPSCSGYAEAYAQLLYDQNCSANPLYDSGCPGYAQAYFDQQCTADPLYNASCPGYASAYFSYQCSLDPLFDAACPGYADALYAYECSADPLYDTGCPGYAAAYLDQQCGLDPLYDRSCDGYSEAYAQENILNEETTSTETTISTASTETVPVLDPEEIAMPSTTGDAAVDSILKDLADVPTQTFTVEAGPVAPVETQTETQETSQEAEASAEADTAGEMEELVASVETETESNESTSESDGDNSESSDESEGETADGGDSEPSEKDQKETKRDKLKKAIADKAANLANDMSAAATLEAQQAVQAQVLALINYVPDFNQYNRAMNGGYLPDGQMYQDEQLPESRKGLRNGLAQQLLHEKMIDMQYNN